MKRPKLVDIAKATTKDMVEHVLKCYPATRENDMLLCMMIYDCFFDVKSIFELTRTDIPCFTSIHRARQKIQAEGRYRRRSFCD